MKYANATARRLTDVVHPADLTVSPRYPVLMRETLRIGVIERNVASAHNIQIDDQR